MSQTKEPWKFTASIPEEGFECFWIESDDEFRNPIADVRGPQNDENTANARRIVACVNACAGISTDSLEQDGSAVMGWQRTARKLIDVTKQRDELLADLLGMCGAIRKALPYLPADHEAIYCGEWLDAAKETIARVRGGKCETCNGRGEVGGHVGQTPESFDYVTEPCPDCSSVKGEHPQGCHRSHPHENMSAECEQKTIEARDTFKSAVGIVDCGECPSVLGCIGSCMKGGA